MAYGGIVGYEPTAQPGAYMFKRSDGTSTLFAGPPAESLKARLDASAGFAGQQVAGPGGGAPADTIPEGSPMKGSYALNAPEPAPAPAAPAMSEPSIMQGSGAMNKPANMSEAPAPVQAFTPPQAELPPAWDLPKQGNPTDVSVFAPPSGSQSAPARPAQPAAAQVAPAPVGPRPIIDPATGINTGRIQLPDGRIVVPTRGAPAVTREQLEGKRDTGVLLATSGSESTTGGFAPDKDYLERRHELAIDKRLLIDKTADVEAENAAREKAVADQQLRDAANLKAEENARAMQIQQQVEKDLQAKDRLQKEYANSRVDPRRVFSGPAGTGRGLLAAISAGLGAIGSGLMAMGGHPGQPNVAMQTINTMIDRDIAAQEMEIKIKGQAADNALNQYIRSGMSLDQARLALRSAQLGWSSAQIAQAKAITKGSTIDLNRDALHQSVLSELNNADEQYRVQSLGTATKAVSGQVQYPHGASGGGYRSLTPAEADQEIERRLHRAGESAGVAKTISETGGGGPQAAEFNKNIQFVESGQGALQNIVRQAGGEMDPKTGKIAWKPGADMPGAGAFARAVSSVYESDDAGSFRKAVDLGAAPIEKGVEGDAAGEAGIKQIKEDLLSGNAEKRRAALENEARILAERRKSVETGASARLRAGREAQREQVESE